MEVIVVMTVKLIDLVGLRSDYETAKAHVWVCLREHFHRGLAEGRRVILNGGGTIS